MQLRFDPADTATAIRLFGPLRRQPREAAAVAFLDPKWSVLGLRHAIGGASWLSLPIRSVARDALAFDARGVVLAHNHPSGSTRPSAADLAYTRRLAQCLGSLDVPLIDHVILTADAIASLRGMGLL